jgi:mersacidin/lichenicidin family type 2 lantibiotic
MSNIDIIRAWKDEDFRNGLSKEQLSQLPENPAGESNLSEIQMESVVGGAPGGASIICCDGTKMMHVL